MRRLFLRLFNDQCGMILSSEVVLVGTILVLGSIAGLAAISHAVSHELNDVASAYQATSSMGPVQPGSGGLMNAGGDILTDSPGIPEVVGY